MTIKNGMSPVHPGLVLREELDDRGLSADALAKAIDVPASRVETILNAERNITADTAQRLGRYFDTTAQFWLNLQQTWQTRLAESKSHAHQGQGRWRLEEAVVNDTGLLHRKHNLWLWPSSHWQIVFVDANGGDVDVNVVRFEPICIKEPYAVKPVRGDENLGRWKKISAGTCNDEPRIYTALVRKLD